MVAESQVVIHMHYGVRINTEHNKMFKRDSQRVASLLCVDFCV